MRALWTELLLFALLAPATGPGCDGPVLVTAQACADKLPANPSWPVVAWSLEAGRLQVIQSAPEGFVRQTCTRTLMAEASGETGQEATVDQPVVVYPPPTVGTPPTRVFDASAFAAAAMTRLFERARQLETEIGEQGMCAREVHASWMAADPRESRPAGAYTAVWFSNSSTGNTLSFDARGEATRDYSIARIDGTDVDTNPADSWSTVAPETQHNWIVQADLALRRIATEMPAAARILMLWANERHVEVRYRLGDERRDWTLTVSGRVIDVEADAVLPECDPGLSPAELLDSYERESRTRGGPPISTSHNLIWECRQGGAPVWK